MQESGSDFIRPVPQEPEKPRRRHRWLIFLGIGVAVLAALFWYLSTHTTVLDGALRSLRYLGKSGEGYAAVSFDGYGVTDLALAGDGLAVASRGGVTLYAENGERIARQQADLTAPALLGNADALLIYDLGGTYYAVLDTNGKQRAASRTGGSIFDADLAENGEFAVLAASDDARAVAEVYDAKGELRYRRTSKSSYLNACALSPDGSWLALATLGQEDISFVSGAKLYRTDSEDEIASVSFGDQTIFDLKFLGGSTVCAVGSGSVVFFNTAGELLGEYTPENGDLAAYAYGDGFVALVLDQHQTGSRYQLLVLSTDGGVRASCALDGTPAALSAAGNYLAVLTADGLTVFDGQLSKRSTAEAAGWTEVLVRADGTAILAGAESAELYIP